MPIGTYTPPLWKTITQKKFSIFFILFFHFRCILLQISHKKCFFISISILGRSGVNLFLKITKEGFSRIITKGKLFHPLSAACWNDLSQFSLFILLFINNLLLYLKSQEL